MQGGEDECENMHTEEDSGNARKKVIIYETLSNARKKTEITPQNEVERCLKIVKDYVMSKYAL